MLELQGIPVSPGIAIGPALVLDLDGYRIPKKIIAAETVEEEFSRLRKAVHSVAQQLEAQRRATSEVAGETTADIFSAQLKLFSKSL